MKCLNLRCDNVLPSHRVKRAGTHISNWYFCVDCLRHKRIGSAALEYECRYEECHSRIEYNKSTPNAYCSAFCKQRKTRPPGNPTEKKCAVCSKRFMTTLGYPQKYCGSMCRNRARSPMSKVSTLQRRTLQLLRIGDYDIATISAGIERPVPSARDVIKTLRRKGHRIILDGYGGKYHLEMH